MRGQKPVTIEKFLESGTAPFFKAAATNVDAAIKIATAAPDYDHYAHLMSSYADLLKPLPEGAKRALTAPLREQFEQFGKELPVLQKQVDALKDLEKWQPSLDVPQLEKNDCSRFHILLEAAKNSRIIDGRDKVAKTTQAFVVYQHVFVMRHDWAGAFEKAEGFDGEWKLPYDLCVFEFRISGRTVIILANEPMLGFERQFTMVIQSGDYWYSPDGNVKDCALTKLVWDQIRAACIALDAEIATHEVVRAPAELNRKRVSAGKPPINDHRLIDLARRHRIAGATTGTSGTRKRLHFRRGHWRHYETHNVWIKWTLVGNPDLGFISRQYAL